MISTIGYTYFVKGHWITLCWYNYEQWLTYNIR